MEHLPVKELDELQDIVPTGEELTLLWHTEMGVGKASLLDVRAATATYIDKVTSTVEVINPDDAPRVEVEETQGDATGRHREYVFHHYLPSGITIDDVSIGTVSSLPAGSAPTAAIRDVSADDETTEVDESKTHKRYKVDIGIPVPYDVDVDMASSVLDANEMPTATWTAEHTDAKKVWHLTLGLPKAKNVAILPATVLPPAQSPALTDEGDVNNAALHFSLPKAWGVDMAVSLTVLPPGSAPTASVTASDDGEVKHFTLCLGLSPGQPFTIAKVYDSIDNLMAGYDSEDVKQGQFAVIDTGSVEDVDTGKLFLKGESAWELIADLSGAQGIRGQTGATGHTPLVTFAAGDDIGDVGTPSVTQSIADNGDSTVTLHCLKGADGAQGKDGAAASMEMIYYAPSCARKRITEGIYAFAFGSEALQRDVYNTIVDTYFPSSGPWGSAAFTGGTASGAALATINMSVNNVSFCNSAGSAVVTAAKGSTAILGVNVRGIMVSAYGGVGG